MSLADLAQRKVNTRGGSGGLSAMGGGVKNTPAPADLGLGLPSDIPDLKTSAGLAEMAAKAGLDEGLQRIKADRGEDPDKIFSGGFISDTFDTLNLLQHGVTGVLQGKGFTQGIKERASFTEKGDDGLGDYGVAGTIGGMLLDIAVDPLTYLGGFGVLKRVTSAVYKGAGELAGHTILKVPAAERATEHLGKLFVYRYGQDPVYKQLAERTIKNIGTGIRNMLDIARPITKLDSTAQRVIADARKSGTFDALPKEVLDVARPAFDELDRLGKAAVSVGLLGKEVYEANVGKYIARLYRTKEAPEGIMGKIKGLFDSKPKRIDLSRFKARTDIPEDVRAAMGEVLEAGYPTAKSLVELTRAVENARFFGEVASRWGSDVVEEGMKQLPQVRSLGALAGKAVPIPIYDDIQEIIRAKSPLEQALGSVVRGFKYGKVILNPATHARNVMSNFILNHFEGLSPARVDIYAKAARSIWKKDELYKEAQQAGLGLDTFAAGELRQILLGDEKGVKAGLKTTVNKIADLYQKEEEFAKMAMYIFKREKGLSPEEAYKAAEVATFNYAQVTPFIRRVRESIFGFPFITFTYKATPQVVKTLATKPTKISNLGKIKQGVEEMSPQGELASERETEPSWVRNGYYLKLPAKDSLGRSAYFDLTYILPFGDLVGGNYFQRDTSRETGLKEGITSSVASNSPLFNLVKELTSNQDFYGNMVYKESDPAEKQAADIFRHLVKTYAPPLVSEQVPGGYRKDGERRPTQLSQILSGDSGTDFGGAQRRTGAQELLRLVGMKVNPVDLQVQAEMADSELEKALRALLREAGVTAEFTRPFVPKGQEE